MAKRLSPQAIFALQEALAVIYHFKTDLRRFLETCGVERAVLSQVDWSEYKRQIVSDVFQILLANPSSSVTVLTSLCRDVAAMDNFSHLAKLEDGARKVAAAQTAVSELRRLVDRRETQEEEEKLAAERRMKLQASEIKLTAFRKKLTETRSLFQSVAAKEGTPQKRGAELEAVMREVFDLFDLDPRASFRITGEQN
jgi:Effector-associated domain 1